ncbi:MAG: hypothetical protein V3R99_01825 [Thermoguttaceae bacterium]
MNSGLLERLIATLGRERITYCHWKSTFYLHLDHAEDGRDLDVLVDRRDAQRFEAVLASLGFKRAVDPIYGQAIAVHHCFGWDESLGTFIHVHVFYRIITGESLLKNYSLPFEKLLLSDCRKIEGIPTPQPAAELMQLVIRVMLKYASLPEYVLLRRRARQGYEDLAEELAYLRKDGADEQCSELLAHWLPSVDADLFQECLNGLRNETSAVRTAWLAYRLRRRMKAYGRFSFVAAFYHRTLMLLKLISWRVLRKGKRKHLSSGGIVIAFVGPEATGKSTLVAQSERWLNRVFAVRTVHAGKPPSSWLTAPLNLLLPLIRRWGPRRRGAQTEDAGQSNKSSVASLIYAVRCVALAWDRLRLLSKARRAGANGELVICDRYPSNVVGAMDSPRLRPSANGGGLIAAVHNRLARLETHLYKQVPPPDIVLRLTVPVETAKRRNHERIKPDKESDAYLEARHRQGRHWHRNGSTRIHEIDTNRPLDETLRQVRQVIWESV